MKSIKTYEQLVSENNELRIQLEEASETIDAIRTGKIDALVIHAKEGHELYTLKTADQTYRVFIEKMTEGAVTLNQESIIIYSNSQFASTLNIPLSTVLGENFNSFISPEYKEQFKALFEKGWKEDCKGEILLACKTHLIPFQLSLTTLQLDEGISLSIILTDLTLQKETQKQLKLNNDQLEEINSELESSNSDLQHFAFVASHDLQEPLRKIQIFSNILKKKHFAEFSEMAGAYLEKIISSSGRMSSLITDILDYSRLSGNDNVFELIHLKPLVTQLLDDFEILIKEKNATVIVEELPSIYANPGQLRQVFQNLISNALKFSKKDISPFITIKKTDNHEQNNISEKQESEEFCSVSIKDNGIGFDEKYTNNIFTMFKRLNNKDLYAGTGIGLSITKKIIEKHGGTIIAKSTEGVSAEFIIILPVLQKT